VILEKFNLLFCAVFIIEMLIKWLGSGFKDYFRDKFNTFDCFIVFVSTVDLIYSYSTSDTSNSAITALRAFRLIRVFKLVKSWNGLQNLLRTVGKSLIDISSFTVLLCIFIFTYTLLGMEMFAYKTKFDADNKPVKDFKEGSYP
jgi:hypothetical protein